MHTQLLSPTSHNPSLPGSSWAQVHAFCFHWIAISAHVAGHVVVYSKKMPMFSRCYIVVYNRCLDKIYLEYQTVTIKINTLQQLALSLSSIDHVSHHCHGCRAMHQLAIQISQLLSLHTIVSQASLSSIPMDMLGSNTLGSYAVWLP